MSYIMDIKICNSCYTPNIEQLKRIIIGDEIYCSLECLLTNRDHRGMILDILSKNIKKDLESDISPNFYSSIDNYVEYCIKNEIEERIDDYLEKQCENCEYKRD